MEPIYEYFYEIQGLSFFAAGLGLIFGNYILHILHRRRNIIRLPRQSPLWLRIKSKFNNTKIGKLNLRSHIWWENTRNKYADKFIFYRIQIPSIFHLRMGFSALSLGFICGLIFADNKSGFRKESSMFILKDNLILEDKVKLYLKSVKNKNYTNDILDWELQNKLYSGKFDVLDYIEFGKLMSGVLQEEIAFQCYYMAHLKDHENIKTNAELNFETILFSNNS